MKKVVPKFKGEVVKGKLKLMDELRFLKYVRKLDGRVELIVRKPKRCRSINQNRLYWLYLGLIEEETGDDVNDLHEYFKRKHLPPKFINVRGESVKIPNSTKDLSSGEFGEYMDKIERETNIPVPDMNLAMLLAEEQDI